MGAGEVAGYKIKMPWSIANGKVVAESTVKIVQMLACVCVEGSIFKTKTLQGFSDPTVAMFLLAPAPSSSSSSF